jgi:hypothetical protein
MVLVYKSPGFGGGGGVGGGQLPSTIDLTLIFVGVCKSLTATYIVVPLA